MTVKTRHGEYTPMAYSQQGVLNALDWAGIGNEHEPILSALISSGWKLAYWNPDCEYIDELDSTLIIVSPTNVVFELTADECGGMVVNPNVEAWL